MNHNRPFVDPNDSYSYEDWMNDMATKEPSEWFTDSPVFHSDILFDTTIEAVLRNGSCFYGKLDAEPEEYYTNDEMGCDEVLIYYLWNDHGFADFSEIKKWRPVS